MDGMFASCVAALIGARGQSINVTGKCQVHSWALGTLHDVRVSSKNICWSTAYRNKHNFCNGHSGRPKLSQLNRSVIRLVCQSVDYSVSAQMYSYIFVVIRKDSCCPKFSNQKADLLVNNEQKGKWLSAHKKISELLTSLTS